MEPQLSNCINFFNKLILNELQPICKTWVAGGCVRDYFSVGYITSDVDLYFENETEYQKCYTYFLSTAKEDEFGAPTITKPKATLLFENDNVVKLIYNKKKYDLVKKYFKDANTCINEFDFTVCCAAADRENVYIHQTFFIDLAKRALVINKLSYPLSTMWRLQKYIQKGYKICSGGMLDLAKAVSKLELHKEKEEEQNENEENPIDINEFYPYGTPKFRGID